MRITWGSMITAGITASVAVVLFMVLIPQILGMGAVDITRNLGIAFSSTSPHIAGTVFLALLGIFWAMIFSVVYNSIPGNYVAKGALFGIVVGLFSMSVLPNIMSVLDNIFGAPNQYLAPAFALNINGMVTMLAYVTFGLIMAWSYRPAESTTN